MRRGQPSSGNEADPTTGEPVGGKHRPTRAESAISVNFEDYANTPDDDDVGALNTQGEPLTSFKPTVLMYSLTL